MFIFFFRVWINILYKCLKLTNKLKVRRFVANNFCVCSFLKTRNNSIRTIKFPAKNS